MHRITMSVLVLLALGAPAAAGTIYHITDQNRDEAISAATQYCKDHDRVVQIRYVTAGGETEMVFVWKLPG